MNRILAIAACLLMAIPIVTAASLEKQIPEFVNKGDIITVTFMVTEIEVGKTVTIDEVIPAGMKIDSWSVEGAKEAKSDITYRAEDNRYTWSFTSAMEGVKLSYSINPGSIEGTFTFNTVYMLPPAVMNNLIDQVTISEVVCGDSLCTGGEDYISCPEDCPRPVAQESGESGQKTSTAQPKELVQMKSNESRLIFGIIVFLLAVLVFIYYLKKKNESF